MNACVLWDIGHVPISVRWSIYIIISVDKPNFRVSLPHRRSTTVSSETNPVLEYGRIREETIFYALGNHVVIL